MLTITALSARGQSASGADVLRYLIESEVQLPGRAAAYYLGGSDGQASDTEAPAVAGVNTSRWLGAGASALQLDRAAVTSDIMGQLAGGFAPDGTALCQNAGEPAQWIPMLDAAGEPLLDAAGKERGRWTGGHRVGLDLTFSADKTLSLAFALGDDDERLRIVAAHRKSVDAAMDYLARQVETRRGKGGLDVQGVRGLVASGHTHMGSRNLDPQLHEHVLVYAIAQGQDGAWGTFDPAMLYTHQRTAGALYRAAMAHEMQRLGYRVEVEVERDERGDATGEVWTHIAGIDPALADAFSSRRAEIEAHMRDTGSSAEEASLATRARKEEPPFDELQAMWRQSLDSLRVRGEIPVPQSADLKHGHEDQLRSVADADLLREVQDQTAVLTREAVLERVALAQAGRMNASAIERECDRLLRSNLLAEVEPERQPDSEQRLGTPSRRYTATRWVMREHLAREDAVLHSAMARRDDVQVRVPLNEAIASIVRIEANTGRALSDEQRAAVRHVTVDTGGLAVLVGRAGTGKTTSMRGAVAAWQDHGMQVIGCSTGWDAAHKLRDEAGIESHAIAALLRDEKLSLHNTVLIVDEAGMVATRDLAALQQRVDQAGGKLVLVGDEHQLQAIGAGGLFGALARQNGHATLTEIRRQQQAADRETAGAFYGNADLEEAAGARIVASQREATHDGAQILERLEQHGQVHAHGTRAEAIAAMVTAYRADAAPESEKLLLGSTRHDVAVLNAAVRTEKRARGELQGDALNLPTPEGAVELQIGDRVRFTRRDRAVDVYNGTRGVVHHVDAEHGKVHLAIPREGQADRLLVLDVNDTHHLMHAYASTVHRAQGQTVSSVWQLASAGMLDRQSALVGFTRQRERYALHGADLDLERIASKIGRDRRAWSAREAGVRHEPTPPPPARDPARERTPEIDR